MNIKIRKISENATLPTKAHDTDACFDIYADCTHDVYYEWAMNKELNLPEFVWRDKGVKIDPGKSVTIHTGFATEIPKGYFATVFCRSGMGIKRHLRLSNSVGIIDSDYRGEWMVALHNDGLEPQVINHGDRIAQFTILPVLDVNLEEVDELNDTDRGDGGFGSSGK